MPSKDWQPGPSQAVRQRRAQLYKQIRAFFELRQVLEVDTPIMSVSASTDPMLDHLSSRNSGRDYYLQTSPEFAMKRLLAAGSGSIYQICRCFRAGESGRRHNPEFVMLEWYRIDFSVAQLIDEVIALLQLWFPQRVVQFYDYRELLLERTGLEYEQASLEDVRKYLASDSGNYSEALLHGNLDDLYDLVLASEIESTLGIDVITVISNYPASQAQLAQLTPDGASAQRFEIYINGIEMANGYEELRDVVEQAERFAQHNERREELLKPAIAVDQRLLLALDHGIPPCSGVALGIDRLLMLITEKESLDEVIEFSIERA